MMVQDNNEALVTLLKMSHQQALTGQTYSSAEVEQFMNNRIYELTHRMDACSVAEPV